VTNPPPTGGGGTGNTPPVATAGYGNAAAAGGSTNPLPVTGCPSTIPVSGSTCVGSVAQAQCLYNTESVCSTVIAQCVNGRWSLGGYAIECPSTGGGEAGTGGTDSIAQAGSAGDRAAD